MSAVVAQQVVEKSGKIDLDDLTDLLTESTVRSRFDLGSAIVYKVSHPAMGELVLVNTTGRQHAVIQC